MENLKITVDEVLRYLASGVFGFLIYSFGFIQSYSYWDFFEANQLAVGIVCVLIGISCYVISRAVFYPPIYFYCRAVSGRWGGEHQIDTERWARLSGVNLYNPYVYEDGKGEKLQLKMNEWGAHIHFLFSCALAGAAALVAGLCLGLEESIYHRLLLALVFIFFAAGVVSTIRYQCREIYLIKRIKR